MLTPSDALGYQIRWAIKGGYTTKHQPAEYRDPKFSSLSSQPLHHPHGLHHWCRGEARFQHKIPRQQGTTRRGTLERGEKLLDMHAPIPESVNPKEATSNIARVNYSSFLSFWHARMPRQCEYDYSTYSKQSIKFRKALFARQGLKPWAVVGATSINSTN